MSLIFEALKKLEREKRVPDRGFLVVAPNPWPERRTSTARLAVAGAGLLLVGVLVGRWWLLPEAIPAEPVAAKPAAPTLAPTLAQASNTARAPVAAPPLTLVPVVLDPEPERLPVHLSERPLLAREPVARVAADVAAVAPGEAPAPILKAAEPDSAAAPKPLHLEAISIRDGQPVAIIDGVLLREGDRLGEAIVVRIGAAEVELEILGERRVLSF